MLGGADGAVALVAGEGRITYGELRALVAAARPTAPFAVLYARNDVASVVALYAALEAGVPIALFDARLDDAKRAVIAARYPIDGPAPHPSLALLLSTSGATGSPKLVRLTRAAVEANARAIAAALAIGPGEVGPTSLPLHYAYGLSIVTSHLAAGATVLLTDDAIISDDFWRACRAGGATSFAGVPYSYDVVRRLDLGQLAPASLRTFTQAGGRMAPAQIDRFAALARARGGGLYVMYGQTEATARIAIAGPDDLVTHPGSVGRAIAGGALAIEDGEVVFRGPSVMLGYASERADLARGDDLQGTLSTGDLGRLDDDGYLYLTGRSKRIAKVFGLRLNLDELEAALAARADAPLLAVVGDGDRLAIVAEATDDAGLAALRAALVAETGLHPSGVSARAVEALPRLASGKIDYSSLATR